MRKRLEPGKRKDEILDAALALAKAQGYQSVTLEAIANKAQCSNGTVVHYFGTMTQLRRAVMRAAINRGELQIVAQGLAARDAQALNAPDELKERAAASMTRH